MARKRVTLFVVDMENDSVLMIHRQRDGKEYYIVPGGGVEDGETVIEAAYREADEETGLEIELGPLLWKRPFSTPAQNGKVIDQIEYAYLITQFNGTLQLRGPEFHRQSETNVYRLEWMSLSEFPNRIVYPSGMNRDKLLKAINGK